MWRGRESNSHGRDLISLSARQFPKLLCIPVSPPRQRGVATALCAFALTGVGAHRAFFLAPGGRLRQEPHTYPSHSDLTFLGLKQHPIKSLRFNDARIFKRLHGEINRAPRAFSFCDQTTLRSQLCKLRSGVRLTIAQYRAKVSAQRARLFLITQGQLSLPVDFFSLPFDQHFSTRTQRINAPFRFKQLGVDHSEHCLNICRFSFHTLGIFLFLSQLVNSHDANCALNDSHWFM